MGMISTLLCSPRCRKTCQKNVLLIAPVAANLPALPGEEKLQLSSQKTPQAETSFLSKRYPAELTYASSLPLCNLPTIHNTIKCTEEQCVYTFPLGVQQSSYHLDTARGNFLCGSADAVFRRRSGPVIESLRSC